MGSGDRILVIGCDTDHENHAYSDLPEEYLAGPEVIGPVARRRGLRRPVRGLHPRTVQGRLRRAPQRDLLAMQVTLTARGRRKRSVAAFRRPRPRHDHEDLRLQRGARAASGAWSGTCCSRRTTARRRSCTSSATTASSTSPATSSTRSERTLGATPRWSQQRPVPSSNSAGDNPPHAKAEARYVEIEAGRRFVCTMEWPDADRPQPVVFEIGQDGLALWPATTAVKSSTAAGSLQRGSRLGLIAGAAAAAGVIAAGYSARRDRGTAADPNTATGPDTIREAITQTRGKAKAPTSVTGFGHA